MLGLCFGQSARTQVEQRIRIQLAYGSAMCRLDFIRMDFQHGLRVDLRVFGQQQVLVGQHGVAAVGTGMDQDAAMEYGASAPGAQPTPGQFATRVTGRVLNAQARVDVALTIGQQHAIGNHLCVVALQPHVQFVA